MTDKRGRCGAEIDPSSPYHLWVEDAAVCVCGRRRRIEDLGDVELSAEEHAEAQRKIAEAETA